MVIEMTFLHVHIGMESKFEKQLPEAIEVIAGADGYIQHHLQRSVDEPNQYVLTVFWQQKENSGVNFRASGRLAQVKSILHKFYELYPETRYFETIDSGWASGNGLAAPEERPLRVVPR